HFAKEFLKGRTFDIPGGVDQAAVNRYARLAQTEFAFLEHIAVHLLTLDRSAHEFTVRTERPAVVNTAVNLRIAGLAHTDTHAAVRAYVQHDMHLIFAIARNDNLILAH